MLNEIYEEDFLGFSYGFRPGRGQHDALDVLCVGISSRKVNFILDADIRSFFTEVSQEWVVRFLEHRIGPRSGPMQRQAVSALSKAGNERLRMLLVVGATAVIRHARPGRKTASAWLLGLLTRKPRKLAAVALANKMARIVWAMMARGEAYRPQPVSA